MSKSTVSAPATAATVRAWAQANPTLVPAEGAHTVTKVNGRNPKGRLHPSVRQAFNKANPRAKYSEGTEAMKPLSYRHTQPSGRTVTKVVMLPEHAIRGMAVTKDETVGVRGPLSKSALKAAAEVYVAWTK